MAYALKALKPSVKVYGVQALGAASRQILLHSRIEASSLFHFARWNRGERAGANTSTVNQYVDGVVAVTEDEIAAAILALIERQRIVPEGREPVRCCSHVPPTEHR